MARKHAYLVVLGLLFGCAVHRKPSAVAPASANESADERFTGRAAHTLDADRLAKIDALVELGRRELSIPGVAIAIVQNGRVIEAKGFGERELGKPEQVDADTLFLLGSITKPLTTLLLARLVDQGKLRWDTPAVEVLPNLRFANDELTRRVRVADLVCACAGLPRHDMAWQFAMTTPTPEAMVASIANIQPVSASGEAFQYSNQLAGVGGFAAARAVYSDRELGAGYDDAMETLVFRPLGMRASTFDFERALRENHASPHWISYRGEFRAGDPLIHRDILSLRPAGGAWSSANDLIRYVQLELARGRMPDGTQLVSEANMLERQKPRVVMQPSEAFGLHATYGIGLAVDVRHGTPIVHHSGSMAGYRNWFFFLPEHGVGGLILTNGEGGMFLRQAFQRVVLEQLFDARPEAIEQVHESAAEVERFVSDARRLTIPADPAATSDLAPRYVNPELGSVRIEKRGDVSTIDTGLWKSELASVANDDGTHSLLAIDIEVADIMLTARRSAEGKRQLVLQAEPHEFVFEEG